MPTKISLDFHNIHKIYQTIILHSLAKIIMMMCDDEVFLFTEEKRKRASDESFQKADLTTSFHTYVAHRPPEPPQS